MTKIAKPFSKRAVTNSDEDRALEERCLKIRGLMVKGHSQDVNWRHAVGVEVLHIKNSGDKYGKNAVGKVAESLGCTRALLYSFAEVAERFPRDKLDALLRRRNKQSASLSFSHIEILSKVRDAKQLDELLARWTSESLSVAELKRSAFPRAEKSGPGLARSPAPLLATLRHYADEIRNAQPGGEGEREHWLKLRDELDEAAALVGTMLPALQAILTPQPVAASAE